MNESTTMHIDTYTWCRGPYITQGFKSPCNLCVTAYKSYLTSSSGLDLLYMSYRRSSRGPDMFEFERKFRRHISNNMDT